DIEITIDITDSINKMASDRTNGIEQFVSAWVKFINCEKHCQYKMCLDIFQVQIAFRNYFIYRLPVELYTFQVQPSDP
ncbi:MAG: phage portal protein, partial [Thermodesulfovibrionales bacterium]|nr:phage portal protein [Thermodesulfovibrionales bacterium]